MTNLAEGPPDQLLDDADEPESTSQANIYNEPESGVVWDRFALLIGLFLLLVFLGGLNMLAFVLAIFAALVIHEAGHFFTGKWSGMKVTEYFIGFGPRIFSWKRGETTYGLKAIPAGAYVRIIGMNNLEEVDPVDEPRTYRQAAWHKRVLTILAGPATHFVIALALMVVFLVGQGRPIPDDEGWAVDQVIPFSAAEAAGLERGDRILAVDGQDTTNFDSLTSIVPEVKGEEVSLEIIRGGEQLEVDVVIGERLTDLAARGYSGLYFGDLVVGFDGEPVANYAEFAALASARIGEQVPVEVVYAGEVQNEVITINEVLTEDATSGFLGVSRRGAYESLALGDAITESPAQIGGFISDIATTTPRLVTTRDGLRSLFGLTAFDDPAPLVATVPGDPEFRPVDGSFDENRPISLIGITALADALSDPYDVLLLVIILNLFFGLFNLLPLLPLDGGHIALATYERLRSIGRSAAYHADAAKLLPVTYVVFGFMVIISTIAMVRDIFDFVV